MYSSALASSFPWQRSFKQAHEAGHHPQRLPQVVGGHVGELLQVLVGAGQVFGGPLQGLLGPLALGDVADDLRGPDDPAVVVLDRGDGHGHVEPSAVLGQPHGLQVLDALAVPHAIQDLLFLLDPLRRQQQRDRLADDLLRPVAEEAFCPRVPGLDDAVEVLGEDGIVGRLDDCRQPRQRLLGLLAVGDVHREH